MQATIIILLTELIQTIHLPIAVHLKEGHALS